jgi:hypothetical protein
MTRPGGQSHSIDKALMASTEATAADFNDPLHLRDVAQAWRTPSSASEVSVRSNTELLYELQISQIELEAQNRFLREAQAKLEALIDAIPDLLFEVGLDGQIYDCRGPRVDLHVSHLRGFGQGLVCWEAVRLVAAAGPTLV